MGPAKKSKRYEEELESSDADTESGSEQGFDSDQNSDYEKLNDESGSDIEENNNEGNGSDLHGDSDVSNFQDNSDEEGEMSGINIEENNIEGNGRDLHGDTDEIDFQDISDEEDEMEEDEKEEGNSDDDDDDGTKSEQMKDAELEELEKERNEISRNNVLLSGLKHHKDEQVLKGLAVKNQKVLWKKALCIRLLLQKAFSNSNKLPLEPIRSSFCRLDKLVDKAYSDLESSCKETLDSMLDLQEALLAKNPSSTQGTGNTAQSDKKKDLSSDIKGEVEEVDEYWSKIHNLNCRIASFRNKSVDKWQNKSLLETGDAALKGKLRSFHQNVSAVVADYMRDPSKTIKMMQLPRASVDIIGEIPGEPELAKGEDASGGGDPELLDDSNFHKEIFKELKESHSEYFNDIQRNVSVKKQKKEYVKMGTKHRKINYKAHERIVNFMAPVPMTMPAMAPKLFENLFGVKHQKDSSTAMRL